VVTWRRGLGAIHRMPRDTVIALLGRRAAQRRKLADPSDFSAHRR
jgi:hypothetical protein